MIFEFAGQTCLLIVCDTAFYAIIVLINTLPIKLIALIAYYKTLGKYQISALKVNFSSDCYSSGKNGP